MSAAKASTKSRKTKAKFNLCKEGGIFHLPAEPIAERSETEPVHHNVYDKIFWDVPSFYAQNHQELSETSRNPTEDHYEDTHEELSDKPEEPFPDTTERSSRDKIMLFDKVNEVQQVRKRPDSDLNIMNKKEYPELERPYLCPEDDCKYNTSHAISN